MDILDLPSISDDDELDYEIADAELAFPTSTDSKKISDPFEAETTLNKSAKQNDGKGAGAVGVTAATAGDGNAITLSSLSQQHSGRKRKLPNSDMAITSDEEDNDSCHSSSAEEGDESQEKEVPIKLAGRLAGRVKRIINKNKQAKTKTTDEAGAEADNRLDIYDGDGDKEEEENFTAQLFAEILEGKRENHRNLKDEELEELYASLDADTDDPRLRLNALYVTGTVESMTTFDITRIFAQFHPETVRAIGRSSFIVSFSNALIAAEMLLEMTKPLRRVRKPKKLEEGELMESSEEDEEGQVKEEDGEDVAIIRDESVPRKIGGARRLRSNSDPVIEVDVETAKIPSGKWRVVCQHVPEKKLIYVRFATGFELRTSVYMNNEHQRDSSVAIYKSTKVRPGLNVFDAKGNELDWDYEHDTRFFDDQEWEEKNDEKKAAQDTAGTSKDDGATQQQNITMETEISGIKIRSRGRGAKKFLQALCDSDDE